MSETNLPGHDSRLTGQHGVKAMIVSQIFMHDFDQCGKRNVCVTHQDRGVGTLMNMLHFNVVVFCFLFFAGLASCKWGHREITDKKKKKPLIISGWPVT